jgi:hypothetical protein
MKYFRLLLAFAAASTFAFAAEKPAEKPAELLTPDQVTALAAIDARMVGVDEIATRIDDPEYKDEVAKQIADLKKRRQALETNFDQGLYEALMHSVISRYQIIALWLKPPALAAPPGFKVPPRRKSDSKGSSDTSPGAYNN